MKFQTTPSFDQDYKKLKQEHQRAFRAVIADVFAPACDAYAQNHRHAWPASLRVKAVKGTARVFEMTWSFASPDGRATFEFIRIDNEIFCRWRRVGSHDVFRRP